MFMSATDFWIMKIDKVVQLCLFGNPHQKWGISAFVRRKKRHHIPKRDFVVESFDEFLALSLYDDPIYIKALHYWSYLSISLSTISHMPFNMHESLRFCKHFNMQFQRRMLDLFVDFGALEYKKGKGYVITA